jgi:hypothetical protein
VQEQGLENHIGIRGVVVQRMRREGQRGWRRGPSMASSLDGVAVRRRTCSVVRVLREGVVRGACCMPLAEHGDVRVRGNVVRSGAEAQQAAQRTRLLPLIRSTLYRLVCRSMSQVAILESECKYHSFHLLPSFALYARPTKWSLTDFASRF